MVTLGVILVWNRAGWWLDSEAELLGHCEAQDYTEFWASPNMWASWAYFLP